MLPQLENFYLSKEEPQKSVLLALREIVLKRDKAVTEFWSYGMPFFSWNGKRFCYLWTDKKTGHPYLGIVNGKKVNHPRLIQGNRSRMKILLIDPKKDLPVRTIAGILKAALNPKE